MIGCCRGAIGDDSERRAVDGLETHTSIPFKYSTERADARLEFFAGNPAPEPSNVECRAAHPAHIVGAFLTMQGEAY